MNEHKLRVSAKGLFFDSQGRVLLVQGIDRHSKYKEYWAAPGGGVEEDESLKTAVERELTEETGYFGRAEDVIFVQDYQSKRSGQRQLEIFLVGKIDEGKSPVKAIEADHVSRFFTEEEFEKIIFLPEKLNPFELANSIDYSSYL